jgi:catechol 2,3-dioxygenase-like lactoylglutathione lyase family enzyme
MTPRAPGDIDAVNHVGIAVRDLDAAAAIHAAMGFLVTPYSPHSAAWRPGDPVTPQGSGNRCVTFPNDYLEILGAEDATKPAARIAGFLARHQGGHILCFNAEDLAVVEARFAASGIPTSGILPLQREVNGPDGHATARFERLRFDPTDSPEGFIQVAKHLTPRLIYQPRWTAHPNGCDMLATTIISVTDLDRCAHGYEAYLGLPADRHDGEARFRLPSRQALRLIAASRIAAVLPGTLMPPAPAIVAVGYRAPDAARLDACLARSGLPVLALPDGARMIPAEAACGIAAIFEP